MIVETLQQAAQGLIDDRVALARARRVIDAQEVRLAHAEARIDDLVERLRMAQWTVEQLRTTSTIRGRLLAWFRGRR